MYRQKIGEINNEMDTLAKKKANKKKISKQQQNSARNQKIFTQYLTEFYVCKKVCQEYTKR
jgi:hypothetical protein